MISPARRLALQVLLAWEGDQAAHCDLLMQKLAPENLEPRDRALAYALVLGVLRQRSLLWSLVTPLRQPQQPPLSLPARLILQLALYQRLFLTSIPAYALISQAVEQAREAAPQEAAAVNALLREIDRRLEAGQPFPPEGLPLTIRYSHPGRLVSLLREEVPDEKALEGLLAWHNAEPVQYARIRGGAPLQGLLEPLEDIPGAARCLDTAALIQTEEFRRGQIYLMQLWSQLVAQAAPLRPGDRVLDLCAAPGGKSLALLDRERIALTACDISESRLKTLRLNFARAGYQEGRDYEARQLDAREAGRHFPGGSFDLVLLDAPCSSLGTIQRNPELRWRLRREELETYRALQTEILAATAPLVRPGGHLLYAVCSFAAGERQAPALLEEQGWRLLASRLTLPGEEGRLDGGYFALWQRPE